jgi:hypothetical protein
VEALQKYSPLIQVQNLPRGKKGVTTNSSEGVTEAPEKSEHPYKNGQKIQAQNETGGDGGGPISPPPAVF